VRLVALRPVIRDFLVIESLPWILFSLLLVFSVRLLGFFFVFELARQFFSDVDGGFPLVVLIAQRFTVFFLSVRLPFGANVSDFLP